MSGWEKYGYTAEGYTPIWKIGCVLFFLPAILLIALVVELVG